MTEQQFTSRRFHFIIDAFDCNVDLLKNQEFLEKLVHKIAKLLEMKILKGPETAPGIPENPGLSTFAIIDFSHISIHTFTNSREFCLDIFSCKDFDSKKLERFVKRTFQIKDTQIFKSIVRYDQLNIERDRKSFSPKQYLNEYYKKLGKENMALLDWYRDMYRKIGSKKSLLEIGGGPTIYQLISASSKVKNITFTDYSQKNLDAVNSWVKNKDTFWDDFIEHVLKGEFVRNVSKNEIATRKKSIGGAITDLVRVDAGERQQRFINKFDVVQSNFCLENSTDDISEYKRMLRNLFHYLKKDGVLLMVALEGAVAYKVGRKYYPAIYLDKELIKEYLKEAGFRIENMTKTNAENSDSSKYHGFLFIKAVRGK